jgi:hypothetical protein
MKSRMVGLEGLAGHAGKASSGGRGLFILRNQGPGQESPAVATHADMANVHGTTSARWLPKAKEIRK